MSVYYLDLEELPCPNCGGTHFIRFPWICDYGLIWRRHVYCEDCGDFLEEKYDDDEGEHEIFRHTAWGTDVDEMLDILKSMRDDEG